MKTYISMGYGYCLGQLSVPNDPENRHYKIMMAEVESGEAEVVEYVAHEKTEVQKIAEYREAVSAHIERNARAHGFDSILTAVSYADEPADPVNQALGIALREWRSACWKKCREDLATWQGGGEEPTVQDVIDGLPEVAL